MIVTHLESLGVRRELRILVGGRNYTDHDHIASAVVCVDGEIQRLCARGNQIILL